MKINLKRFKEVEKTLRKENGFANNFYPKDGETVIIPIVLEKAEDLYDPMAPADYPAPSPDILGRIDQAIDCISVIHDIKLQFHIPNITTEEKDRATFIYNDWFGLLAKVQQKTTKFVNLKTLYLLILGVSILLFSYMMATLTSIDHVFYDTVNICGTFMVWEAADTFFLERRSEQYNMTNRLRMYMCEIEFKD